MLSPVYLRCLLWIVMMTMRVSSLQCRWVWVLFVLAAAVGGVVDELLLAVRHEYVVVVVAVAVAVVAVVVVWKKSSSCSLMLWATIGTMTLMIHVAESVYPKLHSVITIINSVLCYVCDVIISIRFLYFLYSNTKKHEKCENCG